jgi:hypothetical protein
MQLLPRKLSIPRSHYAKRVPESLVICQTRFNIKQEPTIPTLKLGGWVHFLLFLIQTILSSKPSPNIPVSGILSFQATVPYEPFPRTWLHFLGNKFVIYAFSFLHPVENDNFFP